MEDGREGTYVYLWLIYLVVQKKPTQHFKAIILQLKINLKRKKKDEPYENYQSFISFSLQMSSFINFNLVFFKSISSALPCP